jgi:BMFP domain-containing protein YqiC
MREHNFMTQTTNRLFDDFAKLMTDAAGAAQGVKQDADTFFRSQAERVLRELDVVQREEFEAVKAMAAKALEENEQLRKRIETLEAAAGLTPGTQTP